MVDFKKNEPVVGKCGISATVLAKSQSWYSKKIITTFELEYPRYVHSEFMTHRVFSRNAASSRAIPVAKVLERVRKYPALPVHWGANQGGMQAKKELEGFKLLLAKASWHLGKNLVWFVSNLMNKVGLHKQLANRITETYQMIKVVMTTTEIENFINLRNHPDAQPEIQELAKCVVEAYNRTEAEILFAEEWHTPYVFHHRNLPLSILEYYAEMPVNDGEGTYHVQVDAETAKEISAARCAMVSYRTETATVNKAKEIYQKLIGGSPKHWSPFEHQASPMYNFSMIEKDSYDVWPAGVTHMDRWYNFWSGNFKGWIQNRILLGGIDYDKD